MRMNVGVGGGAGRGLDPEVIISSFHFLSALQEKVNEEVWRRMQEELARAAQAAEKQAQQGWRRLGQ